MNVHIIEEFSSLRIYKEIGIIVSLGIQGPTDKEVSYCLTYNPERAIESLDKLIHVEIT